MSGPLDAFELEMRKLPGVLGVGVDELHGTLLVSLITDGARSTELLLRSAGEVVRNHAGGQVILSLMAAPADDGDGPQSRPAPERVRLVAVERVVETDGTERADVHLCHRGRQRRGQGYGQDASAAATLAALRELGFEIPFVVDSVTPVDPGGGDLAVAVVRLSGSGSIGSRLGVAKSDTLQEAASRAVLDALNRFLSGGNRSPGGSQNGPGALLASPG